MNNYCIILAGGTGKRLWPVSTQQRPKQFIDFFGAGLSLLQMTFQRFQRIVPTDHIYVSTHADYVDLVRQQLPDIHADNIVAETLRLSTAPSAAKASQRIAERDADACVVASPADQLIVNEEGFCRDVESAFQRLRVTAGGQFMALAVQATQPYTSYGYIQRGEQLAQGLYRVKTFTEKPDREFAEIFVQSDEFLWNTGLFLWHVATMERLAPEVLGEPMVQQLDGMLLDRHRDEVVVQECKFGWTDVGCWPRMQEVSHKDVDGNAVLGSHRVLLEGCSGSTIAIDPGNAAIVKGLDGYLVAYHDHTLLIMPNDSDTDVKRLQTRLENQA